MAEFLPFEGLRYNLEKVLLDDVLAPPYDVVDADGRQKLLERSPHNVIDVELPQGADDSKYDTAAQVLQDWRNQDILSLDDAGFYIYEQEFTVPNTDIIKKRRGILGALKLEEFGDGVKPHENTLSGPKEDRLKLLRATETNTSPIFGLYGDEEGWSNQLLDAVCRDKPQGEAADSEGVIHRLWHITDAAILEKITSELRKDSILIADGHHRYETALNYRRETGAANDTNNGANYVMMMCVSTSDPGLVILPTHRMISNADAAIVADLPQRLQKYFSVEKSTFAELESKINAASRPSFGVILPDACYQVTLKEGQDHLAAMDDSKSAAYNELDVTILHRLILENELGIDSAKLAAGGYVSYTIFGDAAHDAVQSDQAQVAFILRPTRGEQVSDVANAGDKMPQKSTYYYPKLATGLVLRPLNP